MPSPTRDTIFALSSGRLPAAIAVVRISGSRAGDALKALTGKMPDPRKAAFARVRDPQTGELIDEALALWFPGPNSETGEDTAELQLHGGRAVLAATLRALSSLEGLRPAEAGEFTRRAFENGKLDLTAVESLADLVGAETEAQRRQAFRQMQGALRRRADAWREKLIQALALVEAGIDFSDEGDVPADLTAPAITIARELEAEISAALADGRRGERLREGLVVAIAGPPNAGKSSVLNRIAKREAAIVSPHAGTTRDVIEVHLDLEGYPVTLLDTAGIRETDEPVELEGVRRAQARAAEADLVLWVVDATRPEAEWGMDALEEALPTVSESGSTPLRTVWLLRNKADLLAPPAPAPIERRNEQTSENSSCWQRYESTFEASASTGKGLGSILNALTRKAEQALGGSEPVLITRARHRLALRDTQTALKRACRPMTEELLAEELRTASRTLERLTGRVDVEDVLDVMFRDFCIGK
jgi:tRNA modification GTPase